MIHSQTIRERIAADAVELKRLHTRVHATFAVRDQSPQAREAWIEAARDFRDRYDLLAFPGGECTMKQRLLMGNPETVESAICFLEVRPYFFRSGYMFKDLIRWCRKVDLTSEQQMRFDAVDAAYRAWRKRSCDKRTRNQ